MGDMRIMECDEFLTEETFYSEEPEAQIVLGELELEENEVEEIEEILADKDEERLRKYFQAKEDFEYFCKNFVYLELPGGNTLMNPYKPQLELIKTVQDKKYVLVLKSRQIGITTVIQAFIVWLCIFYKNVVVGIISKNASEATDFNRCVITMIDNLPPWIRPKFKKKTEQSFILENGCKCHACTVNPNNPEKTLRGKAVTVLIIDEAAFVNHIDEAYTGIVPALSTNQMQARKANVPYATVVLSTPNKTTGVGKWYYSRYQSSISGTDIFNPYIIHWKDVDEISKDPLWYRNQCELFGNDLKKIEQELELKFLPSGGSFFNEATCLALQDNARKNKPIEIMKIFNGEAWQYYLPIVGNHYIIGVDTATEFGEDKSAIVVLDYRTFTQVWEYQGKLPVTDFCKVVMTAASLYRGTIVIERNSVGNQVMETLSRSDVASMVYAENRKGKVTPGLNIDSMTRPLVIDGLYSYVSGFPETIKSSRLVTELIGLVEKPNGRVEGDKDCRDDLALAYSFCAYVRKYDPVLEIEQNYESMASFQEIMNFNTPHFLAEVTNSNIRDNIKNTPEAYQGWVDILSFYNRE